MSAARSAICALVLCSVARIAIAGPGNDPIPLPTNPNNFYIRGTQPNTLFDFISPPEECGACHGGLPDNFNDWQGSLMAHAARDPMFYAALDIAENDAPGIGDTCLRCHAPQGWLEGRADPTDGSALDFADRSSVSCSICHRSVDPFGGPGAPSIDPTILADLGTDAPIQSINLNGQPGHIGNGGFVIDPFNRIRGPFPVGNLPPGQNLPPSTNCNWFHNTFLGQPAYESALHRRSDLCASCHDVSTPHFIYNSVNDEFAFAGPGVTEPSSNKYRMMPQQRTYSEWRNSQYAAGGVDMLGRFGGDNGPTVIQNCMDCHMPKSTGNMCNFVPIQRSDIGRHFLNGASTWVMEAIAKMHGPEGDSELSFDTVEAMAEGVLRSRKMLKCAADLDVTVVNNPQPDPPQLRVRVINQTGHKLPTGFPEGRRMWLNVEFYDLCNNLIDPIAVFGEFDEVTHTLDSASTKVYEAKIGPNSNLAPIVNLPAGPSFHVALSNQVYKDNRIPPRGFSNSAFAGINAAPIGAVYADGQHWDDTFFPIPPNASGVRVRLFYESASREYIEFLRDRNPNAGTPETRGEILWEAWNNDGAPPIPVLMASFPPTYETDDGMPPCSLPDQDLFALDPDSDGIFSLAKPGDANGDLTVDTNDIEAFVDALLEGSTDPRLLCVIDFNSDQQLDGNDVQGMVDLLITP